MRLPTLKGKRNKELAIVEDTVTAVMEVKYVRQLIENNISKVNDRDRQDIELVDHLKT